MNDATNKDKFVVRLPDGLRPLIAATAQANERSMNGEIVDRLKRSFMREQLQVEQEKLIGMLLRNIEVLENRLQRPNVDLGEADQ